MQKYAKSDVDVISAVTSCFIEMLQRSRFYKISRVVLILYDMLINHSNVTEILSSLKKCILLIPY